MKRATCFAVTVNGLFVRPGSYGNITLVDGPQGGTLCTRERDSVLRFNNARTHLENVRPPWSLPRPLRAGEPISIKRVRVLIALEELDVLDEERLPSDEEKGNAP